MKRSRALRIGWLCLSLCWAASSGCSGSKDANGNGPPGTGGGSSGGSAGGPVVVPPDMMNMAGVSSSDLNPLCGVGMDSGTCDPDQASACAHYSPPGMSGGAGGAGGNGGGGAGGNDAGNDAGGNDPGGSSTGGASGSPGGQGGAAEAGQSGAGGGGGESGSPPASPELFSCQVTRQSNLLVRQCVSAGTGLTGAPCFSAAECAAGLACVTEGDAGRCLPYCCDPQTSCSSGSFCAERPLRRAPTDTSVAEPPHVPVCVPADDCSLEEPFPCDGNACRCKGTTACMVVREDGTTACVEPGKGQEGDACPCAWNHVCSSATHECVKLCHTDPSKNECGTQKCQASSELPSGFGVCVGPLK